MIDFAGAAIGSFLAFVLFAPVIIFIWAMFDKH